MARFFIYKSAYSINKGFEAYCMIKFVKNQGC